MIDRFPLVLVAAALVTVKVVAAERREARVLWRGVEHFDQAEAGNAMSVALRRPANAGTAGKPSLFVHPNNSGRATLRFPDVAVGGDVGSALFFVGWAGISDGMHWDDADHPADGARFYVTIDGEDVVRAALRENRWQPLAAPLPGPAGRAGEGGRRQITLATDCGEEGNANYDWALFGDPALVALPKAPLREGVAVEGTSGIVVYRAGDEGAGVLVEALTVDGTPVADAVANGPRVEPGALGFVRFDFAAQSSCIQWCWRTSEGGIAQAQGGSWRPRPLLTHVGSSQAVVISGDTLRARVGIRNEGLGALLPGDDRWVSCNGSRHPVPRVAPGEEAAVELDLGTQPGPGPVALRVEVCVGGERQEARALVTVWPPLPALPAGAPGASQGTRLGADFVLLQTPACRWLVCTAVPGMAALVFSWGEGRWEMVGSVSPFAELVLADGSIYRPSFVLRALDDGSARFDASAVDSPWTCTVRAALRDSPSGLRIDQDLSVSEPVGLLAMRGPAYCVGDRASGTAKGVAVFPGLEYLEGEERSSSARDLAPPLNVRTVPHRFKITLPLMLVETRASGPVGAVAWDPKQAWDGERIAPAACFASPNFLTHQDNHLMQLMLPSVPDGIAENARQASDAVVLSPGKPWRLVQYLLVDRPVPDASVAFRWYDRLVGYPDPEGWPRSFEDEVGLCRHAFLNTAWDAEDRMSLHYVGSGTSNSPGFATLMLTDARTVAQGEAKSRLLERVSFIAEKTLSEQGGAGLTSSAACHIMGWEFPYHWGRVPEALRGMRDSAYGALSSQEEDGGWGYYPDERRGKLGESGARVVGICGRNVYLLAKWVAISGDPVVEEALRKGLAHMRRYVVPRGAQGWECPIYEPDVLGSAYAVRACVWAYMALGEKDLLERARFWARTGLPFQYVWDDGQRPGMRYASIPVFGSTFFTHSWLGLPVQWCGLVYAYALQELLRYGEDDLWRRQVDGMVASATHQQWPLDNPELAGTYPDSYGAWFTRRNPVHINPEDILVNVLAARGADPGLRSAMVPVGDGPVHVTAPAELRLDAVSTGLTADLRYCAGGEVFSATVAPVSVSAQTRIVANGGSLARRDGLGPGVTGWAYHTELRVLTVSLRADREGRARLEVRGIEHLRTEAPVARETWEFDGGTEGWHAGHSCEVDAASGHLRVRVTGDDPYAIGGAARIEAKRFPRLRARVRLTAGSELALFWRSSRSTNWGPDKEKHVAVAGDGQWREVVFDLGDHALWDGTIQQVRLDPEPPGVAGGTVLEIDWIRPER